MEKSSSMNSEESFYSILNDKLILFHLKITNE